MAEVGDCKVGLSREEVGVLRSDHKRLLFAVFGQENGIITEDGGLVGLTQRREAQLSLIVWIIGPSSVIGMVLSAIALFRH